jgi:O-antigen/teichoic acid export membrane protein
MEVTSTGPARFSVPWRAGIATADQVLLSATNFVVSILLIQTVPKEDFGYYSVALPISLLLISLQDAVVNTPLTVLLASKTGDGRRDYVASLCYGQFLVVLPAAGVVLALLAFFPFPALDPSIRAIAAALCVTSAGLLYREFLRSYLFAEEDPLSVLKLDVLHVAIFLCAFSGLHRVSAIRVSSVFLLMGGSALLSALWFGRKRGWRFPPPAVSRSYGENWRFGKWALAGVCVSHAQSYSYLYLLGIFAGSAAVADVTAARLLLMPLMLLQAGWGKIAVPYGSRLREAGKTRRFFREQIVSSLLYLAAVAAYVALLLACQEPLQRHLLTGKYASSFRYVMLWGAVFAAGFLGLNASFGLQAMMRFGTITKVSFLVMLVTVGSAWFLIRAHGIAGGLAALLLGEILLGIGLWIAFGRSVSSATGKDPATLPEKGKSLGLTGTPP